MDRPLAGTLLKFPAVPKARKLLDMARHYPCAWCNRQDGTTVAAHCTELALGRGFAHKTPDFLVAYLCHECHDYVDGRRGVLSLTEKRAMWNRSYVQTVAWWFRDGVVVIS